MKLITKLLPIAIIFSASCAIVPIATSCTSQGGYTTIDIKQLLACQYSRKTAIKPITEVDDREKAIDLYLSDVKRNPQILVDDIFEYGELFILDIEGKYPLIDDIKDDASGTITFWVDNINANERRLSLSCKIDIQTKVKSDWFPTPIAETLGLDAIPLNIKLDAAIKDVKFTSYYASNPLTGDLAQAWSIEPDYVYYTEPNLYYGNLDLWLLQSDHKWEFKANEKIECPLYQELYILSNHSLKYNYKSVDDQEIVKVLNKYVPYFFFTSNYLANTELTQE